MRRVLGRIGCGFKTDNSDTIIRGIFTSLSGNTGSGNARDFWYGTAEGYGYGDGRGHGNGQGGHEQYSLYPFELIYYENIPR